MHILTRNNPDIIADAKELTCEAFSAKYREVISQEELYEVYSHIRLELGVYREPVVIARSDGRCFTFKVLQTSKYLPLES